jgi:hypothetical protein
MSSRRSAALAAARAMPAERGILFGVSMIRAILAGTKTQTRRLVAPQPGPDGIWSGRRPYGVPGDHLWVREMWRPAPDGRGYLYAADLADDQRASRRPWRPSLLMPRVASRLTLLVEAVRMERLQAMTEADAAAEGIPFDGNRHRGAPDPLTGEAPGFHSAVEAYAHWWDALCGEDSWRRNEWVWVIQFRLLR